MKFNTKELQKRCAKLYTILDNQPEAPITNALSLIGKDGVLTLAITNLDYYAKIVIPYEGTDTLESCVNAETFLSLIAKISTENVEITADDKALNVKGNGDYKLDIILGDNNLIKQVPVIKIDNITLEFETDKSILKSIVADNGKEFNKGVVTTAVQRFYYIDDKGAITFTSGACINNFKLAHPIKLLINQKAAKSFSLFTDDAVHIAFGTDNQVDKLTLSDSIFSITIVTNNAMVGSFPADNIRERATSQYPHTIVINRDALVEAISRRLLFTNADKSTYSKLIFNGEELIIGEPGQSCAEKLTYTNKGTAPANYVCHLDVGDLKGIVDNNGNKEIEMSFGDTMAFIIKNGNVTNVVPEVEV